jgi:hypothetical protein
MHELLLMCAFVFLQSLVETKSKGLVTELMDTDGGPGTVESLLTAPDNCSQTAKHSSSGAGWKSVATAGECGQAADCAVNLSSMYTTENVVLLCSAPVCNDQNTVCVFCSGTLVQGGGQRRGKKFRRPWDYPTLSQCIVDEMKHAGCTVDNIPCGVSAGGFWSQVLVHADIVDSAQNRKMLQTMWKENRCGIKVHY